MYSVLLTQKNSCVLQWQRTTTLFRKNIKAREYVARLDNLDKALNPTQRQTIFDNLKLHISLQIGKDGQPVDREMVTSLTAAQCKIILQDLHNGLRRPGLSQQLNRAKFEAVNVYSSERAKGKVCALYEYFMKRNPECELQPVGRSSRLPAFERFSGYGVEGELRRRKPASTLPPPSPPVRHLNPVPASALTPAPLSTSTGLRLQRVSEVDENGYPRGLAPASVDFLNAGVAPLSNWTRDNAITFSHQAELAKAIRQLKWLSKADTIRDYSTLHTRLPREVDELLGQKKYSRELNEMAKNYLLGEIIQSKTIDRGYRTLIASLMAISDPTPYGLSYGKRALPDASVPSMGPPELFPLDPYADIGGAPDTVLLDPPLGPGTQPEAPSVLDNLLQKAKTLVKRNTPDTAPDAGPARAPLSLFEQPETGSRSLVLPSTDKLKTAAVEAREEIATAALTAKTKLQEAAGRARATLETTGAATRAIFSRMGQTTKPIKPIKWAAKIKSAFSKTDKPDTDEN